MHHVERYLTDLRVIYAAGGVAETSGYPPLLALLSAVGAALAPRVLAVAHPASVGAGIPDLALYTGEQIARDGQPKSGLLPARGVVEVKGVAADIRALAASAQVKRYLDAYGLVLACTYRAFAVVTADASGAAVLGEVFELAPTADAFRAADPHTLAQQRGDDLIGFLTRVLLLKAPLRTPKDLAAILAAYAREAALLVERQSSLAAYAGLRSSLEAALGITFQGERGDHFFRSTLVQTLFYGIFSGWVLWHADEPDRTDQFSWRLAASYLHLPVLQSLFGQMVQQNRLRTLGLLDVLRWADEALARVERAVFFTAFAEREAVQYFYEPFLAAFDPELRRELGVWYTPPEIVRYQVERVDRALREELGVADGLADPNVLVLDPCCGTGAYLVGVIERIAATLRARGDDDLLASDLKQALTSRVFGFELLPAPFVVAHLQLGLLLQRHGAALEGEDRAAVYLTNALTGWERGGERAPFMFPELEQEREAASRVKHESRVLVVLGNPPYSGYAGIAMGEERTLSNAYRTTAHAPAPQGQGLNDLYVRFYRMAERQIVEGSGYGVVSYISNYSWLDGLSFTGMRERYMDVFDSIWVDNLHGDRIISEYAPDGRTSETVFAIQGNSVGIKIGTAIATLVRRRQHSAPAQVLYRDWQQARAEERRAALLASISEDAPAQNYTRIEPLLPIGLPLKPREVSADYLKWPLLPALFPISFPGVKTSRDDVVVDIDRERLERRMRAYFDPAISHEQMARIAPGAMESTARFAAEVVRTTLQKRGFLPENIIRYCYRPFDVRWLYWEPETKLLDEKRTDYKPHVFEGNIWIEGRQKQPMEHFDRGYVVNVLSDNFGNGLSNYFPLLLAQTSTSPQADMFGEDTPAEPQANLTPEASAYLGAVGGSAEELFYHAIATLHAPAYRSENAGALRQDWPRVPLPATADALQASAALGRQVAALLDPETPVAGVTSGTVRPELLAMARLRRADGSPVQPQSGDLALTAGWGYRGRGGIVMPARGRTSERPPSPDELAALGQAAALLGGATCDIWLNDTACWRNVPLAVWEYTIGGYQVLKKWLSYRERPLLERDLSPDEARHVTAVVRRIAALLLLGPALDASYRACAATPTP
ncbi:N-6 DNA methylase [Chloroflexia bacterium SDU3-3]|nr:N-6 DNA methylase [Chloroflexia bacterium SDU3-3]